VVSSTDVGKRKGEVEGGGGPGGPAWGNGPDGQWVGEEKRIKIQISKLISMFRKIDYRESGGKNNWEQFLKNVENLGRQECEFE
jgi:hypothetical protein